MNAYGIRTHPLRVEPVVIERMAAADLVLVARRAATIAQGLTHAEAELYARRFEALIQELEVAALCMRKGRPEPHTPQYLRPAGDALTHD